MKSEEVPGISGLVILRPDVFRDERGCFYESYNAETYKNLGITDFFSQDNHSVSRKNVIRGLHFQAPPYDQGKLVRVVRGKALDITVDIRKDSPSYGKTFSLIMDAETGTMLWIPPGFAHGFAAYEDDTVFLYKCTSFYNKHAESGIIYNDPDLSIDWGVTSPIVSPKDLQLGSFNQLASPF